MFERALGALSGDLAVDLGTCNTRVYVRGRGIAVEEPSVVAVERTGGGHRVVAVGAEAERMVGRTPENIDAVRPLRNGVIRDFDLAEALLAHCFVKALGGRPLVRPRVLVCTPYGISETEQRAIQDAVRAAGAREVHLVEQLVAAALGAGLPVNEPIGSLLLDIGAGHCEAGMISLGGVVSRSVGKVGGEDMDAAIAEVLLSRHNVLVGERTAEQIKLQVGCATPPDEPRQARVMGRDIEAGVPREVALSAGEACEALQDTLASILDVVRCALADTPPELAADAMAQGMVICGGGALLPGLLGWMREQTGLPVLRADDPRRSTILGARQIVEGTDELPE